MNTFVTQQAEQDFSKAHNKALINEIAHFLSPKEASLISFNDIKYFLKPRNELYLGMKTIPVNKIVGSEGRYKDFDNEFFPKSQFMKNRWMHVDEANIQSITLPPIKVYELAGLYFVRDGNHRVSVAKLRGIEFIDAEVVSLQSEIVLSPMRSLKSMVRQIISYEKREFYAETLFGDITDFWGLDFSTPGQYDVIYHHIITHKYFMNQSKPDEIPLEEAVLSWFKDVYCPIVAAIESKHIMRDFHGRTKSDLYVWLVKYWDELKKKFGEDIPIDEAASDFKKDNQISLHVKIKNAVQKFFMKKQISASK